MAEIAGDGRLRVHGWTLASSPIVAVQIFVDGRRVGAAIQNRERGDVADAYPAYPNARHAGFVLERAMDEAMRGAANVTAQVLCLSGACLSTTIPLVQPAVPPPAEGLTAEPRAETEAFFVVCDHAAITPPGVLLVEGWATSGPHRTRRDRGRWSAGW